MIQLNLMLYCLVCAGGYVIVASLLLGIFEKNLRLYEGIPNEMREESGLIWTSMNIITEVIFLVVIPTVTYGFFHLILPVVGIRAGLGSALFAFVIGAAPLMFGISTRLRLPMPLMLFTMLSFFIKLAGSLAIIGYLYSL